MGFNTTAIIAQIAASGNGFSEDAKKELLMYGKDFFNHELNHSKQNMEERKSYANCIFVFTCLWCLGMFIVLIGCGMGKLKLSNIVLTTFIGSTTINVFIFFKLVTEYLFNKDNPHS